MNSLVIRRQVVPKTCRILQVGLWVTLLGVNEERELGWVAEEEDWGIVVNPIPVALVSVKLEGETAGISCRVCRSFLATDSRESSNEGSLLANDFEHVNGCL